MTRTGQEYNVTGKVWNNYHHHVHYVDRKPGLKQWKHNEVLGPIFTVFFKDGGRGGGYVRSHECCFVCWNAKL